MALDQGLRDNDRATLSPLDLKQLRDALREVRTSHANSALADLVEEKIRALETGQHDSRSKVYYFCPSGEMLNS
jgi:transcription initiation factor IIE alpha subunit